MSVPPLMNILIVPVALLEVIRFVWFLPHYGMVFEEILTNRDLWRTKRLPWFATRGRLIGLITDLTYTVEPLGFLLTILSTSGSPWVTVLMTGVVAYNILRLLLTKVQFGQQEVIKNPRRRAIGSLIEHSLTQLIPLAYFSHLYLISVGLLK